MLGNPCVLFEREWVLISKKHRYEYGYGYAVAAQEIFFREVIKKFKLKKKTLILMSTPKKHKYTHMQIQENLHFFSMSFYILKSLHDILLSVVIIYCQCR